MKSTQLTTQFSLIVSLPVLASWVSHTTGLSPISPTGLLQSTSGSSSSFIWPSCGVPQGSVFGPTIVVSCIASIISFHGVNQQHYADYTSDVSFHEILDRWNFAWNLLKIEIYWLLGHEDGLTRKYNIFLFVVKVCDWLFTFLLWLNFT